MPNSYLIVVDMQNDFIDGALGTPEAQAIVEAVAQRANSFDGTVVFTKDTHDGNYAATQEGRNLPVPHCIKGTQGWELAPALGRFAPTAALPCSKSPRSARSTLPAGSSRKTTPRLSTPLNSAAYAPTSAWSATPSPSRHTCPRSRSR